MQWEKYQNNYRESLSDPAAYWAEQAKRLDWRAQWTQTMDCSFAKPDVHIAWFKGGTLNVAENCVDRHLTDKADQPAIIWVGDNPNEPVQHISYADLSKRVNRCANMLTQLGVKTGDCVTIYMSMIPQAAVAMLACARIGAIHSVVFGGFSPAALRGRIQDCDSHLTITVDEGLRGGKTIPLKANVDEAIQDLPNQKTLVVKRTGGNIAWDASRDVWWHEAELNASDIHFPQAFDAEHPLFILYTSGSTGKPKGLQHSSAGYLLYAMHTFEHVFDYKQGEVFWCTADVGWITGHSYMVYGPLAAGATTLLFEGIPTYPDASRFWQIVDAHQVALFYTAPTAIRMLMKFGDEALQNSIRKSLRILGSVGEPINPTAWQWYHDKIGHGKCEIVDTWWQTETGGHMLTPLPYAWPTKAGSATLPYFGIEPKLFDAQGHESAEQGALCIAQSWPGQARTIWNDHPRFIETYFTAYPNHYFSGDAARKDADCYYWIEGRMDDVINVSGHRIGTAEVEAALNGHEAVVESAVVGFPHDIKGQAIYAFVILNDGFALDDILRKHLNQYIRREIGPLAVCDKIQDATSGLPKTRSGKIMRRILRKIAAGEIQKPSDTEKLGDISTLLNPEAIKDLVKGQQI